MPRNKPAFRRILWHEDFLERYARAREAQADKYFQEIIEIADAATPETVNVARLRDDSRKFTVARLAPKKYGDRISHDVKGGGVNFQPQILIQCSSAGEEQEYIDISAAPEAAGSLPQQGNGNSLPGSGGRRQTAPHSAAPRCGASLHSVWSCGMYVPTACMGGSRYLYNP